MLLLSSIAMVVLGTLLLWSSWSLIGAGLIGLAVLMHERGRRRGLGQFDTERISAVLFLLAICGSLATFADWLTG